MAVCTVEGEGGPTASPICTLWGGILPSAHAGLDHVEDASLLGGELFGHSRSVHVRLSGETFVRETNIRIKG